MHTANDLVMCLADFNGHVGRYIDGHDGMHGGYGISQTNLDGRILRCICFVK